jgi:hypothetical protein
MQKLKKAVESAIRGVYGFDESIRITDVEVFFNVATGTTNGAVAEVIPEVTKKRGPKRRKPRKLLASKSLHREYSTSPEDIACMRHFFSIWRKTPGLLSPNAENFIAQTTGVYYARLSQETKSRMREIFEETREKVLFKKRNGATV